MFEKGYSFKFLDRKKSQKLPYKTERYKFKTSKNRVYWIIIEQYEFNIYVVKFHLSDHQSSKRKYNFVLNDGDAGKVIRTVIDVMIMILQKDEMASLGFIGSEKYSKQGQEAKANTQRFRIYKYITNNYFGLTHFDHYSDVNKSAYLIVNKKNLNTKELIKKATRMFQNLYEGLEEFDTVRVSSIG